MLVQGLNNIKITILDDDSTNDTLHITEADFPFPPLIGIDNQGASKVRNLWAKLLKGEFIQYLGANNVFVQEKLKLELENLQSQKGMLLMVISRN